MKLTTRLALLAIPLLLQLIYFPSNRLLQGGWKPETVLDAWIPLWPIFALPYLAAIPYWCFFHLWAALEMEDRLYKAFIISSPLTIGIGMAFFLLLPSYVERPMITQQGFAWDMLRFVYSNDGDYNALPSGHAYITTVVTYYFMRWKPRLNPFWIAWWFVILVSAVVTGQHYLLDLVAGVGVAATAIIFGKWAANHLLSVKTDKRQFSNTTL